MALSVEMVAEEALGLPTSGRALLVEKLLASLAGEANPTAEHAHLNQIRERRTAVRPGAASLVEDPPGMSLEFTAVYLRFPEGYAAFVEELPGANTQGTTLDEARANLLEAARMIMEANRQIAEDELRGQEVIREHLVLGPA